MSAENASQNGGPPGGKEAEVSTEAAIALLKDLEGELLDGRMRRCTQKLRKQWKAGKAVKATVGRRSRAGRLAAVVLFVLENGLPGEVVRQFLLGEEQRLFIGDRMRALLAYPFWLLIIILFAGGVGSTFHRAYFHDTLKGFLQQEETELEDSGIVPPSLILAAGLAGVLAPFALSPQIVFDSDLAEACPVLGYDITLANDAAVCRLIGAVVRSGGDIVDACRLAAAVAPTAARRKIFHAWHDVATRGVEPVDVLRSFPIFSESIQHSLRYAAANGTIIDGFDMAVVQLEERVRDRARLMWSIPWLLCLALGSLVILEPLARHMIDVMWAAEGILLF
ncbi:MAG: hypothetical protein D6741_01045 [Planctomycetota bacterium]|nr:MAG: hypothetical protein D6741_01045 [Planctomycetota bacterium]